MVKNPPANSGDIRDPGSIAGSGRPLRVRLLAWGPNKGTGNSQGTLLGRLVGFDDKASTELGETETLLLEGTNKTLHAPRLKGKEQ